MFCLLKYQLAVMQLHNVSSSIYDAYLMLMKYDFQFFFQDKVQSVVLKKCCRISLKNTN